VSSTPTTSPSRKHLLACSLVIIIALTLTYATSFQGPFLFDDNSSIKDNPSIRHFSHLTEIFSLHEDGGLTVSGRPVLNASLALSYALSGESVFSYHLFNFLIHLAAALTLFGIVRRTLSKNTALLLTQGECIYLSFITALLWAVHPLQTESVTYIIQRAESLMGLFYFLSIYGFIRYCDESESRWWAFVSLSALFLGAGTKEVMVSAPFFILLYDRALISGTFKEALRRHIRYYGFATFSLIFLGVLAIKTGTRNHTSGFGLGVGVWQYWQTQFQALTHYLYLSIWPNQLVFDYGAVWTKGFSEYFYHALICLCLGLFTVYSLIKNKAYALIGFLFFAVLAPTSLIPGTRQTLAEHRMYVPLAAVVVSVVLSVFWILKKCGLVKWGVLLSGIAILLLSFATRDRNALYQDPLALYRDTVTKRPENAFAHYNLANQILLKGRPEATKATQEELLEASHEYEACVTYAPYYAEAYFNWGNALVLLGKSQDAVDKYQRAIACDPKHAEAEHALATELTKLGASELALKHLERAEYKDPNNYEIEDSLAIALTQVKGREAEVEKHFLRAISLKPTLAKAHNDLALFYSSSPEHKADARKQFLEAIRLDPSLAEAHANLAFLLSEFPDKTNEAVNEYVVSLKLDPLQALAHNNLANLLSQDPAKQAEAISHYEAALKINPQYAEAHNNLANLLNKNPDRLNDAIHHYKQAIYAKPDYVEAHYNLGATLGNQGRLNEAAEEFKLALKYNPNFEAARDALHMIEEQAR
jgi:protein O-mannosyl-transferase